MSLYYAAREEPNGLLMQEQVQRLGGSLGVSTPGSGKLLVFDRFGEQVGDFSPPEWFDYVQHSLEAEAGRWKLSQDDFYANLKAMER